MEISQYMPSEILEQIQDESSPIRNLVLSGYDLKSESFEDPFRQVCIQYDYPDDRAVIFVAREGDEVLGTLSLILWKDTPSDKRGSRFWPKLRQLNPDLARRATTVNPLAADVGGVVSNPEKRGRGIGIQMYQEALSRVNPSILLGQTKTVGAVIARSQLSQYRTFYGTTETSRFHPQEVTDQHLDIVRSYLYARGMDSETPDQLVFAHSGGNAIAPTLPNVEGCPPIIQRAFAPVIASQKRYLAQGTTMMSTLISVSTEALPIS